MYYIKYLVTSKTKFDIHSPFVFEFIENIINDKRHYYAFDVIENRRKELLKNHSIIPIDDFGAGSKTMHSQQRKVSTIAKKSLITQKFGEPLFRIANHFQPQVIIELGTSLGISTSYLCKGAPAAQVITLEGSNAIANIANQTFSALDISNVKIVIGEFSETLPKTLRTFKKIDLAFIDGNHRQQPTLDYFEILLPHLRNESILIFDDIHWSREMQIAWGQIKGHASVTLTIDLFFKGVVFLKKDFHQKEHYVIKF